MNMLKYFDWGEIGERIIARALELKKDLTETLSSCGNSL
jgi:hypothetical protein